MDEGVSLRDVLFLHFLFVARSPVAREVSMLPNGSLLQFGVLENGNFQPASRIVMFYLGSRPIRQPAETITPDFDDSLIYLPPLVRTQRLQCLKASCTSIGTRGNIL